MIHVALFLGFSLVLMNIIVFTEWRKKIPFKTLVSLFLFGVLLSTPFIMVEYVQANLKYYFVILAFILIEVSILYFERRIKYFHDLVHHNIRELRIVSFFLIGIGFTFSEIAFYIFHSGGAAYEIIRMLPMKTAYALFMHTVLTMASSLTNIGDYLMDNVYESILKFVSYYLRIAIISTSHFLYVFFAEHNYTMLLLPFLAFSLIAFFYYKKALDENPLPA